MQITTHHVVTMNYTVKNNELGLIDSSEGREPLVYLHGVGGLIPGLEAEIEGLCAGDKKSVVIAPENAYGPYLQELLKEVSKSGFEGSEMHEGMRVELDTEQGPVIAVISQIDGDRVVLDLNHPLAGQTLEFDIEIVDVRMAEQEEIDHGHVHGPGGHHH